MRSVLRWLGFGGYESHGHSHGGDLHGGGHGHTHGVVDPTIVTTQRGIWAIKWSFVLLAITAAFQLVVVVLSGSVALLADTIHNIADAATAVPLWIAFALARRRPSARFTYGYGRVEDLAGGAVVLIILSSAVVAGWQAVDRLIHPQAITYLAAVAVAGVVGFVGNEMVAVFRIRVGREIQSAALIADGYHARVDGLTSLAVVLGAVGVWLGFPLADPLVGLVITAMILGIVWQSAKAVFTRMLDGVDPHMTADIQHAAEHVPGIKAVAAIRSRWLGHRLHAEAEIVVDDTISVADGRHIAEQFRNSAKAHLPVLSALRVEIADEKAVNRDLNPHGHGHQHGHAHGH